MRVLPSILCLVKVLKKLSTQQLEHLATNMLKLAVDRGGDVVKPRDIIGAWHGRQLELAQNGQRDDRPDGATIPARRNTKEAFNTSGPGRRTQIAGSPRDDFNKK